MLSIIGVTSLDLKKMGLVIFHPGFFNEAFKCFDRDPKPAQYSTFWYWNILIKSHPSERQPSPGAWALPHPAYSPLCPSKFQCSPKIFTWFAHLLLYLSKINFCRNPQPASRISRKSSVIILTINNVESPIDWNLVYCLRRKKIVVIVTRRSPFFAFNQNIFHKNRWSPLATPSLQCWTFPRPSRCQIDQQQVTFSYFVCFLAGWTLNN